MGVLLAIAIGCAGVVGLAFCLYNGRISSRSEFPLDDAWIHQVYVRGLLHDGRPTYNPGHAEAGFSSPLWLLLSLPFHLVGMALVGSPVGAVKIASLACAVVAAVALARLGQALGAGPRAALIGPAIVLFAPGFAFSGASGMEVTATSAALALALGAVARRHWGAAGGFFALAALARPEATLAPFVAALVTLLDAGDLRARLGRVARLVLPTVVALAAIASYDLAVTGYPLPNTFYLKAGAGFGLAVGLQFWFRSIVLGAGGPYAIAVGVMMVLGLMCAARDPARRPLLVTLLLIVGAAVLAIAARHPLVPGVLFYCQRYFYPFTILGAALALPGISELGARVRSWTRPGALAPRAARLVMIGLVAAGIAAYLPGLQAARTSYAAHCADIAMLHTQPALDAAAATAPGDVIAVEGAGSARFHAGRTTLDLVGLNDHQLAHAPDLRRRSCLIAAQRPTLVLVPQEWLAGLAPAFTLSPLRRYVSAHWSANGGLSPRVVVAARARLRPEIAERCAALIGVKLDDAPAR